MNNLKKREADSALTHKGNKNRNETQPWGGCKVGIRQESYLICMCSFTRELQTVIIYYQILSFQIFTKHLSNQHNHVSE